MMARLAVAIVSYIAHFPENVDRPHNRRWNPQKPARAITRSLMAAADCEPTSTLCRVAPRHKSHQETASGCPHAGAVSFERERTLQGCVVMAGAPHRPSCGFCRGPPPAPPSPPRACPFSSRLYVAYMVLS